MRRLVRIAKEKIYLLWFIFFLILIYYVEFHQYSDNTRTWTDLQCESRSLCTKILLVADPQLIGYRNERYYGVTPFSVWDSDRYLSNTFQHAFKFTKPDVIIFLGDLFDEGYIANDYEFRLYARRLFKIFLRGPASHVKHIWLPGDNDIGGEGRHQVNVNSHTVKRFDAIFSQPESIYFNNITFYKINRMIQTIPKLPQNVEFYDNSKLVIGLSHVPLIFIPSPFVEKVLARMQPHLIFAGHDHKSMVISTDALTRDARQIVPMTQKTTKVFRVTLGTSDIYEILVPPSSYRMGTDQIGYGFATIENGELQYTVLWSPKRFPQLFVYFVACCLFLLFLCFRLFLRCRRYTQRND